MKKIRATALALFLFPLQAFAISPGVHLSEELGFSHWGATSANTPQTLVAQSLHAIAGVRNEGLLVGPYFDFTLDSHLGPNVPGSNTLTGTSSLIGIGAVVYFGRFYVLGALAFVGSYSFTAPKSQIPGYLTDPNSADAGFGDPILFRAEAGLEVFDNIYAEGSLRWSTFRNTFQTPYTGGTDVVTDESISAFSMALGISVHL